MFRYMRTNFKERNVPGLKANSLLQTIIYMVPQSVVGSVVDVVYV
jgi:hypothetical protein